MFMDPISSCYLHLEVLLPATKKVKRQKRGMVVYTFHQNRGSVGMGRCSFLTTFPIAVLQSTEKKQKLGNKYTQACVDPAVK